MSLVDALQLAIGVGMFVIALIGLIVTIVIAIVKK